MKLFSFEKSIGAVIFRKDRDEPEFLLLKYKNGHWGFPKGHPETGESEEETLRREAKEETGLEAFEIIPEFRESEKYWYLAKGEEREKRIKNKRGIAIFKKVYYYLAETRKEKITLSHEHKDYAWLNFSEAKEQITYRNSKRILEKANKFICQKDKSR